MGFNIDILVGDDVWIDRFSKVLTQKNFKLNYYKNLSDYFEIIDASEKKDVLETRLCFADVRLISEGELILQDHPLLKDENFKLAFFVTKEFKPLLRSTFKYNYSEIIEGDFYFDEHVRLLIEKISKENNKSKVNQNQNKKIEQKNQLDEIQVLQINFSKINYLIAKLLNSSKGFSLGEINKNQSTFYLEFIKKFKSNFTENGQLKIKMATFDHEQQILTLILISTIDEKTFSSMKDWIRDFNYFGFIGIQSNQFNSLKDDFQMKSDLIPFIPEINLKNYSDYILNSEKSQRAPLEIRN
jgi:hypothetical protein